MKHQNPSSFVPLGFLATRVWLSAQGVSRHTIDNWVKSQQLISVHPGILKRPDTILTWQGVVASLQRMNIMLTPGGLTALSLQGLAHFLEPSEHSRILLYGAQDLPTWLNKVLPNVVFLRHPELKLDLDPQGRGFHLLPWTDLHFAQGTDKMRLLISSPELAILEVLLDVPQHITLEHARNLLEGMPTLRPQRLTQILDHCSNIKVKRLFLWLAEQVQPAWLKRIDVDYFSMASGRLGSGKRMIVKDGKLDPKYLITVPQEADHVG